MSSCSNNGLVNRAVAALIAARAPCRSRVTIAMSTQSAVLSLAALIDTFPA